VPASAAAPDAQPALPLGRVVDAWGVRGWIKIEPFAPASDSTLTGAPRWHLQRTASPGSPGLDQWLEIEHARRHGATVVAKPRGCEDRSAALALRGAVVGVRRADFPALPDGEFYWVDLIGCGVSTPRGDALGTVVSVDDHGAHAILSTDAGHLIPFVDAYIVEADPVGRRIVADWEPDWSG
jgi:16S rRNA processing protein RimM